MDVPALGIGEIIGGSQREERLRCWTTPERGIDPEKYAPTLPLPHARGREGWGRVRGPLRESELVETPLHPDPLHSPSKTGVNALMASGEREKINAQLRRANRCAHCLRPPVTSP